MSKKIILKIPRKNNLFAAYWALHVFRYHEIDGDINVLNSNLIAKVEIPDCKLEQLLKSFKTRKVEYKVIESRS